VDPEHYGYQNASGFNSWGGASIQSGNKWYLFASQIQGKCPLLGHWSRVSEVVRAVSDNPTGPFVDCSTVLPSFAHNAKPFLAPDGTWLIYYIGNINNITQNCSVNSTEGMGVMVPPSPGLQTAGPVMIASSKTVDAPASQWQLHGPITDSASWHSATNPSPVFFNNGSVLLAVSRNFQKSDGSSAGKRNVLMRADSWRGPYMNISQTATLDGSIQSGEDPDLFQTKRGWHMLNHNTGPGSTRMWLSEDGISNWTESLGTNAFNQTVQFANGTIIELCQRQRPQVVMSPEDGMPGWLWTGVMSKNADGKCPVSDLKPIGNPTWTLAQKIGRESTH
jgi:hypothetical protein